MSIDNRIVGANIAKLRNNRGMTQFQLAAALNVSHQAVSKWETGAALPDIQTLLTLTRLFGVTMEALLNTEIVICEEEEAPEETAYEEPAQTIFPGFLNDLIPEEAKKALKNAAGEARKTFIEVSENLSACADKTVAKAVEFAEKAKSSIESRFQEAKETPAGTEEAKPETAQEPPRASISFEKLSRMAPFMSREKLSDLVLRYAEDADLESIVQIAPFLTRATVQKLLERSIDKKADNQLIRRLAPFADADMLYKLIIDNIDQIDWRTLESLAPFLKRHMVDALAEYVITGVKPEKPVSDPEPQSVKETFMDAFQGMMGEIGNMVGEIGNAARSVFTPRQEANRTPEEPEVPEEPEIPQDPEVPDEPEIPDPPIMEEVQKFIPTMEKIEKFLPSIEETEKFIPADDASEKAEKSIDKATRHALKAGNWSFIRDHINEITDKALMTDIAVSAISAVAQTDGAAIIMKIAHRLSDEGRQQLFEKVAGEEAWELAVAIHSTANEENAKTIIEKAALAEDTSREDAYLAIECYAKIASRDVLEKITEQAVSQDNWLLINALTDAY